jgi:putative membrane protein
VNVAVDERVVLQFCPLGISLRAHFSLELFPLNTEGDVMEAQISEDKRATEYLANERTFLAWIRTSIAIVSLGFVVSKFGVWLRELAVRIDPKLQVHSTGFSLWMGVAMMALGALLSILAVWRYHVVNLAIERGEVKADRGLVIIVTVSVVLVAVGMIAYMFLTVDRL